MNILMITENDPAGMGIAFTNAINRHTDHDCRLITTTTRYNFDFEKDVHIPDLSSDGFALVRQLLKDSDIIHFHILADENIRLGPLQVKDYIKGKAILHHHHGHPDFRANPEKYREKYRRLKRRAIVSTPDLLRLMPEASWQPNIVPIDTPLYLPASGRENDGGLRICHSPTRKELKNTEEFLRVIAELNRVFCQAQAVIVENTSHKDCLRIKQGCPIHFDHMQGYFGVSSLEGLSQGKAVIAGLDDWNIRHIREYFRCEQPPWIIAKSECEMKERLQDLLADREMTMQAGKESRRFMEEYWSPKAVLAGLTALYRRL